MKHNITQDDKTISYELKKSKRAKNLRIAVYPGGKVTVTAPHRMRESVAHKFVRVKFDWILTKCTVFPPIKNKDIAETSRLHYLNNKKAALHLVQKNIVLLNMAYGFEYNVISIKNHKTKWGSCSAKKNLNFNYKIVFLPRELQEYIIVHELCHLKEMNHSKHFWALVAQTIPDYKKRKKQFLAL
jgi:predicted metal-dependent hydrolase